MPSFDVVSEVNGHELTNAVDQARRELETRFDFRGTGATHELEQAHRTAGAREDAEAHFRLAEHRLAPRGKTHVAGQRELAAAAAASGG